MKDTLTGQLRNSIAAFPDRIAVEDPSASQAISYRELGIGVENIRAILHSAGVRRGDRVGLYAPKSAGTVLSIHGILAAGAAYVPVDALAPSSRCAGILEDCRVRAIIIWEPLLEPLQTVLPSHSIVSISRISDGLLLVSGTDRPDRRGSGEGGQEPAPSDVAYVLYTSGSTGRPKGVVHTHASAVSFVDWCSETFQPRETDRFSSHAPFHFDLSILDLFVSAKRGAAVVLIGEESGKQPQGLAALIAERRLTVWYSTPSALRLLSRFGRLSRHDLSALRLVLFAGEVFPPSPLRELATQLPAARFFNLYGPTETNVCTYFEVASPMDPMRTSPYPIGYTCANDRTRVVDGSLKDVTPGEEGELCVAGGSVMTGYWNATRDSDGPFIVDAEGVAWYRTGDLVRETPHDGFIFLGRRDRMVKRRGYRVELGEIEAALSTHPLIAEAAVTAISDDDSGVLLEASLVSRSGDRPSIIGLKQFCVEKLPVYMVPDRFRFLDAIPQTSTGKTDYRMLMDVSQQPAIG